MARTWHFPATTDWSEIIPDDRKTHLDVSGIVSGEMTKEVALHHGQQ